MSSLISFKKVQITLIFSALLCFSKQGIAQHTLKMPSFPANNMPVDATSKSGAINSKDPLEAINRPIFKLNDVLDKYILKPLAQGYSYAPNPVKAGIHNMVSNVKDGYSVAHHVLQAKPKEAVEQTLRFSMNTVFGLAGSIDVATKAGIAKNQQNFGDTFERWGVPSGPYLVLPLMGPSTVRNSIGAIADMYAAPQNYAPSAYQTTYTVANVLDTREQLLPLEPILNKALDKYSFVRNAYMQQKSKQQTIQLESDKELQSSIEDDVDIPAIAQNTENKVANTNILENTNDANTQTVQALPDLSALPKLQIEKLVNSAPNQIQTNQYNHKETESTKQLTHYKLDMQ
jgi:phospholipid-binding lipoprotein MlaA